MQQFTVPQFIDVENKIIGPITVRQFLIFLTAAILIGISYKIFDFALFILVGALVFIVAVVIGFVKVNGQFFHLFILNIIQNLRRPNVRVWGRRPGEVSAQVAVKEMVEIIPTKVYQESHLADLALIVDTKGRYRGEK